MVDLDGDISEDARSAVLEGLSERFLSCGVHADHAIV